MIEIKHILQRIGKLITLCEVRAYVVNRQEAALDQRQQRRVVPNAVRNITRLRERRNSNKRKAGTQLVEIRALRRIWTGWIKSQRRAEQFRISDAGVDSA